MSLIVPTSIFQRDPINLNSIPSKFTRELADGRGSTPIRGGHFAPPSGIPAPPARFRFGYHTSKALTSAAAAAAPVLSPSNHGHSTIHMQCLPGHIGRLVRGEKNHRGSHLFYR